MAIRDSDVSALLTDRRRVVEALGEVLTYTETPLPWGAYLIVAALSGPARLDLYIERESELKAALRFETARMLFDRGRVAGQLTVAPEIEPLVCARLKELMQTFFLGIMWPARLAGRGEWGTLFYNAGTVIYQFLVPAILIQDSPEWYYRPHFHNESSLSASRRTEVDDLAAGVARVFEEVDWRAPEPAPIVSLYERLLTALWSEFRAACEKYGVKYLEAAERETREYLRRELGMFVNE